MQMFLFLFRHTFKLYGWSNNELKQKGKEKRKKRERDGSRHVESPGCWKLHLMGTQVRLEV